MNTRIGRTLIRGCIVTAVALGWWACLTLASPVPSGATLAKGTILYLHLQTAVSTKTSKAGQVVTATVAREVDVNDQVAVPYGSSLNGSIEKCSQPATSDQRAELLLSFKQLVIPKEGKYDLKGYLSAVSNARESLSSDGTIVGVLQSETPASLLGGFLSKIEQSSSTIGDEIQKQKIGQVNTAVELPVGTDIQFTLSEPLTLPGYVASAGPTKLAADVRESVNTLLANAPKRAQSKTGKPGDPLNLVVIGTTQQIEQAFTQAGWLEPKARNDSSIWKTTEAVINDEGYNAAPVSDLYLFGRKQDLAFEKTLNTFNKRHHLRLWQTTVATADGRPIWLGAATHDVGIDVHPGVVSHATDPDLDDERSQVGSDLFIGGAVDSAELVAPPDPLTTGMTATGGAWHTDGRLFAIAMRSGAASSK